MGLFLLNVICNAMINTKCTRKYKDPIKLIVLDPPFRIQFYRWHVNIIRIILGNNTILSMRDWADQINNLKCIYMINLFTTACITYIKLTRRVPPVEQKLLTLPKFTTSFRWVRVTWSLVLCVCFVDRCLSFCTFLLVIVFSDLLRFTDTN